MRAELTDPLRAIGSRIGLGCMRLSTEGDVDADRAIAVIHAALDAGTRLLDTAPTYHADAAPGATGDNERLVARALATWSGDRSSVTVATKCGMTRPGGRWVANGKARHLANECEASLTNLDVAAIDLYQLHAPDPATPLETSIRALAKLQRSGVVRDIGLCNVTVAQLERALAIAPIAAVQVAISPFDDTSLLNGIAAMCAANNIRLLAHRPLGGVKKQRTLTRDSTLGAIAARRGATPAEIALAWLLDLHPIVEVLPGATRVESVQSSVRARDIALDDVDRAALDARFPGGRRLRGSLDERRPGRNATGEVVILMGIPAAGKSTLATSYVERGYTRLNRDDLGGRVRDLLPKLDAAVASGHRNFVLDNTYPTRYERARVVDSAWRHGLPVSCVWLETSLADAQINACGRMITRHGRLIADADVTGPLRRDPGLIPPRAQLHFQRELEPPSDDEGFTHIERMSFARRRDDSKSARALFVTVDDLLWRSRSGARTPTSPDDVEVVAGRSDVLREWHARGFVLIGLSWQPDITDGTIDPATVEACFSRLCEQLGVALELAYCPHAAGPPVCWCRKPLPGLGVEAIERHEIDPGASIYVGDGAADRGFASRCGFEFRDAATFFAPTIGD